MISTILHVICYHLGSTKVTFLKNCRHGSFDDEVKEITEVSMEDGYRMAMKSMLRWARQHMDPTRTRVFFTSMSPSHEKLVVFLSEQKIHAFFKVQMNDQIIFNAWDPRPTSIIDWGLVIFTLDKYRPLKTISLDL